MEHTGWGAFAPKLDRYLSNLRKWDSTEELWQRSSSFLAPTGLDRLAYARLSTGRNGTTTALLYEFDAESKCSVRSHSFGVDRVDLDWDSWSSPTPLLIGSAFLPPNRRILGDANGFLDWSVGMLVPLRPCFPDTIGGIAFGSSSMGRVAWGNLIHRDGLALRIAAMHMHARLEELLRRGRARRVKLRPSEQKLLEYLARHRTAKDAYSAMGISKSYYDKQSRSIRNALGVAGTSQAVRRAEKLGLIGLAAAAE